MQLDALLRLGFPSAAHCKCLTLLHITTRWLVLQKARHHTLMVLWPVVGTRFQVLFHSPSGVLFTFPSRYCFTIGHQVVFSLGRWSSLFPTKFHVFGGTLDHSRLDFPFRLQVCHLLWCRFPTTSAKGPLPFIECPQPQRASSLVWALSFSLAATKKIDVSFSSSGYLDVSVLRVCLPIGYVFPYGYLSVGFPIRSS